MKKSLNTRTVILCGLFAALSAVGAFIRVPLPLIPFTLQLPIVMLSAFIIGKTGALIAQLVYLAVGLIGFPVFTKGGGIGYVFEPTFGYLIGFAVMAYVIGALAEKVQFKFLPVFGVCVIGIVIDYIFGVGYMYLIMKLYLKSEITVWGAVVSGALTFLPKDLLLCGGVAFLALRLKPLLSRASVAPAK